MIELSNIANALSIIFLSESERGFLQYEIICRVLEHQKAILYHQKY